MQLLSSLLFGISASLDGILVGISFGLRRVRIRIWQNLIISIITLLGTCLSALLGGCLLPLLPDFLSGCIGSLTLVLLGMYYVAKWILKILQNRCIKGNSGELIEASRQRLPCLSVREILFLSMTLSVNNVGIGLSASMAGLKLAPAAISTLCCSVLFLFIGNRMGQSHLLRFIGDAADPISGLLLIGLGILQLVL